MFHWPSKRPLNGPIPPPSKVAGLTVRAALFLGFGLTFGIWLFTGYQIAGQMGEIEADARATNARFSRAQARLSELRSQVLLGSVYVRDALLDPDPDAAGEYRRQLEDTYSAAERALSAYEPMWNSTVEGEQLERLQRELNDFRTTLREVLAVNHPLSPAEARAVLRDRIVPRREGVIKVSDQVQLMNRRALLQQRAEMSELYRAIHDEMWHRFGLGLAGSLGIALLAAAYAGRLEQQIRRQRARDIQNTRDVERLSARLICAQEDERRSLARDLHDEVGQALTAIKVELGFAQRAIEVGGGSPFLLNDARAVTDGALQTVRDLSRLLHPAILDDLGLVAATRAFAKGFAKRYDVRVELALDEAADRMVQDLETVAYRAVQEALTNVGKHARATMARVTMTRDASTFRLTVEDNGIGFDAAAVEAPGGRRGLGLIGIRERVGQAGGTVRIDTAAGRGTALAVELPLRVREDVGDVEEDRPRVAALPQVSTRRSGQPAGSRAS